MVPGNKKNLTGTQVRFIGKVSKQQLKYAREHGVKEEMSVKHYTYRASSNVI